MSVNDFKAVTEKIAKMHDETAEQLDAVMERVMDEQTKQYARAWASESWHDGFGLLKEVKGISEQAANEVFDLLVSRAAERTDLEADGEERLRQIGHYLEGSLDTVLSAVAVALKAYQMANNPQRKKVEKAR